MNILLDKAKQNAEASLFLKEEEYFASSVHCSYYSCIQLMNHILFNVFNVDEAAFNNNENIKNNGSHNYLINQICLKAPRLATNKFKNDFRNLKALRKDADYNQVKILKVDCENAIHLAQKLKILLTQEIL